MAVISMKELWQDRGADSAGPDSTTATRQWRAITDNKLDDFNTVITHGLSSGILPQLYSGHPSNAYLTARNLRADSQSESPLHWIVTATYSSEPLPVREKEKQENPNPLNRKARIRWQTKEYFETSERDVNGKAKLNSAGDFFDPPPTRRRANWQITVMKNMTSVPAWLLDYRDCVINNASFVVDGVNIGPKEAMLTYISIGEEQEQQGVKYRPVELHIELATVEAPVTLEKTWTTYILDQGLRRKISVEGGLYEQRHIEEKNEEGEYSKVTSPRLLNGAGGVLTQPSPESAVFLPFDDYREVDFSVLPLT